MARFKAPLNGCSDVYASAKPAANTTTAPAANAVRRGKRRPIAATAMNARM